VSGHVDTRSDTETDGPSRMDTQLLGLLDNVSGHPVDTVMSGQASTNHLQGGSSMSIRWLPAVIAAASWSQIAATMHGGRAWTVLE
jgi:hypothetical protein